MDRIESAEIPGRPTDPGIELDGYVPKWPPLGGKPFAGAYPGTPDVRNIDGESPVLLTLPKQIYAVTGVETKIHFRNLIFAQDKDDLVFRVDAPFGAVREDHWAFTPGNAGRFLWRLTVSDRGGRVLGRAETAIRVAPSDAGNACNAVILTVGDSMLADGVVVRKIRERLHALGNRHIRMMGSHSGLGAPLAADRIAVEAYGGWKWQCFMRRFDDDGKYNSKSKFIRSVDGKITFALREYMDKYNDGKAPDAVIFALGCNDIALAKDGDLQERIRESFAARKTLISEFRRAMPDAIVGVTLLPPPNLSEQAFAENYKGEIIRPQYVRNQFEYMRRTLLELQDSPEVSLIPLYAAIDEKLAYPPDNALHPCEYGKQQFADTIVSWLKNIMFETSCGQNIRKERN